ncbi:MAG: 3-phosphoglycerate dehydrogenase, partial [Chromatiales bacterium]
ISNSVNFPEINLPRIGGFRIAVVNSNVPNMVGQISSDLGIEGMNIVDMLNKSRGDVAVTLLDVDKEPSQKLLDNLASINGVLSVRSLGSTHS